MRPIHVALAVLIAALWGFNFVVIKIGIDNFPPILFSALRFSLAALPLAFFIRRPDVSWALILGIGLVLGVIKFTLLFVGMDVGLSAGLASVVLQSQAFFTVILASFVLRERPTRMQMLGIITAFSGIGLIATTIDSGVTPLGLTLAVAAAFAWACSNLLMKRAGAIDMLGLIVWVSLVPPIPLYLISLVFEGWQAQAAAIASLTWPGAAAVAYIAFAATIFGFGVWGKLIRTYGAAQVAPFSLLVPIFGMSSSALFLGEAFGPVRMAAALLVILGLVMTVLKRPTEIGAVRSFTS